MIALVQAFVRRFVQNYDVHLSGLPPEIDGTVIVAMSDLLRGTLDQQAVAGASRVCPGDGPAARPRGPPWGYLRRTRPA